MSLINDLFLKSFYFSSRFVSWRLSSVSDSKKKWQEKAELLARLENQVKRTKEGFDSKERLLLEERNKATEAHK